SWVVARVVAEKPEFLTNMAALPFPAVAGGKGDPGTVLGGINCGFAVSKDCKAPKKAIELLKFLTADEVVGEWCEIGRIPALKTTPQQEERLPAPTRDALAALRASTSMQPYYDQYLTPRLAVEHKNTTQNIFAGTMTPEEAAQKMAKK
ncbi:MAG: extracellular solute-binding protein, partial [Victivallales bacterium]|nr:extracellular solute-binding protein [Victivallales bacterium]